jgi:hypothetical protein
LNALVSSPLTAQVCRSHERIANPTNETVAVGRAMKIVRPVYQFRRGALPTLDATIWQDTPDQTVKNAAAKDEKAKTFFSGKTILVNETKMTSKINNTQKQTSTRAPHGEAQHQKQEKYLKDLSAEAQQNARWVDDWFAKETKNTLKSRFELGQHVKLIYDAKKDRRRSYGDEVIEGLCHVFDWDTAVVYGSLRLTDFSKEKIEELCNNPMSNGKIITFSHLRVLAGVKNEKKRERFLKQTLEIGWTVAELTAAVQNARGKNVDEARGRPLKLPKDLPALVRQQERPVNEFLRRSEQIWPRAEYTLLAEAKKLPEKRITADEVATLKTLAESLRKLSEKAIAQAKDAEDAAAYLTTKLAADAAKQSAA